MTFDPDKFLNQQKMNQGFDPDLFLQAAKESEIPDIEEEMHPAVSWKDRAKVKNFGTPEQSIKYLKEKYPNLEVRQYRDRVLFKGANEDKYKVLDPDAEGFDGLGEMFMDVSDVGADVVQGGLEGLATAGGAIAAGAGTAGVGALAGGMAAGAASGAGLEALKQKIGQALDVRGDMNTSDIVASGAFGAASPLLFGSGTALKQGVKTGMKGLAGNVAEKGLGGMTASGMKNKVMPAIAEMTSGVDSSVWKTYRDDMADIDGWIKNPDQFVDQTYKVGRELDHALEMNVRDKGQAMGDILDQYAPDLEVDVTPMYRDIQQQVFDLKNSTYADDVEFGNRLDKEVKKMFKNVKTGELRSTIGYDDAKLLRDKFKKMNRNFTNKMTGDPHRDAFMELGDSGYAQMNDIIDGALDQVEMSAGKQFKQARAAYREALTTQDIMEKKLFKEVKKTGQKDYSRVMDTMKNLDNDSKLLVKDAMEKIDPAVGKKAKKIQTYLEMKNPKFTPKSGGATTTSRTLATAGLGALAGANVGEGNTAWGIGAGLLAGSPKAWKFYTKMGNAQRKAVQAAIKAKGMAVPKKLKPHQSHMWKNTYMNLLQDEKETRDGK